VTRYVAVGGTWSWNGSSDGQWYEPRSPWASYARKHGCLPIVDRNGEPFVWSSDANGWQFWRWWFGGRPDYSDWKAGARHLFAWLVPPLNPAAALPPEHCHVICHSHGLQVVLMAAAMGLKINTLIDVCGPVRQDIIVDYGQAARANIGYMLSIHSDESDDWQRRGSLGDGKAERRVTRAHPLADVTHFVPQHGHSKVLTDPSWFFLCDTWFDLITQRDGHRWEQPRPSARLVLARSSKGPR
jgi:hypothetical protein